MLLIIPWAVPAYITALTWRGMFDYEYGAVNLCCCGEFLNLATSQLARRAVHALRGLHHRQRLAGFSVHDGDRAGRLAGHSAELYEAARIDRASRWQQFRNITLPLLKPVLLPAVTLGAIWTFNNLNVIWLVSNGGEPPDQTHILVSYVYKAVFNLYRYGYGAALSMVIFFMLLTFSILFLQRTRATESVYGE